jgi:outer membrane protein OmpA-like peptidoglycan-associated protein
LQKAVGNQAFARLVRQGVELPSSRDPREREAREIARPSEASAPPEVEPRDVRLHTDAAAARMADALDSRAFTIGKDIFFGAGQFDPSSATGNQLIQHELAHATLHDDPGAPALFRGPLNDAPTETLASTQTLTLTPEVPAPSVVRSQGSTLATIYFGHGNFLLADARSIEVLERLAEELRFLVDPTITVDGFASSEGSDAVNLALSENRRQAVIALLSAKLTQPASFGGSAHGEADLAVPETADGPDLERQRAQNRRVEIFIAPRMPLAPTPTPAPIDLRPRFDPRPETDNERLGRILREEPPTRPPDISVSEAVRRRFDETIDSVLSRTSLSREWRERIRNTARAAAEGAVEKAIDSTIDATPLGSQEREALKQAIRAALQTPTLRQ